MCCGVGISTRALRDAFPDSEMVVGLDTSTEMISMAKFLSTHLRFFKPLSERLSQSLAKTRTVCKSSRRSSLLAATFARGNAEQTKFPSESFDLVTVMYAFHEAPKAGRHRILQEAYRVLQPGGTLAVIDISTDYKPSKTMLSGEPYGRSSHCCHAEPLDHFDYVVSPEGGILFLTSTNFAVCVFLFFQYLNTRRTSTGNFVACVGFPMFDIKPLSPTMSACGHSEEREKVVD
jgi:SAM-dependent methyltransferase